MFYPRFFFYFTHDYQIYWGNIYHFCTLVLQCFPQRCLSRKALAQRRFPDMRFVLPGRSAGIAECKLHHLSFEEILLEPQLFPGRPPGHLDAAPLSSVDPAWRSVAGGRLQAGVSAAVRDWVFAPGGGHVWGLLFRMYREYHQGELRGGVRAAGWNVGQWVPAGHGE